MIKASVVLKDNTEAILALLQDKALAFVAAGGQAIRSEAAARAAVDTGNMRSSLVTESFVEDGVPVSETGPTAEYARYVEFGTSKMKAQPFMEPGYQAAIPTINNLRDRILKL